MQFGLADLSMLEFELQNTLTEKECAQQLKKLREDNVRNSELVLRLGENLVFTKPSIFGDDIFNVYEQLFIAALDLARFEIVDQCLEVLDKKFPDSVRVHKLKGTSRFENDNFQTRCQNSQWEVLSGQFPIQTYLKSEFARPKNLWQK